MNKLNVFKIGGGIIKDSSELNLFLQEFANFNGDKILVHGGGRGADTWLMKLGLIPEMVEGRRITNSATLEVITMHYAGLTNKKIVSQLQSMNSNAVGLSGADGNSLKTTKRTNKKIDYGWVGDLNPKGVNVQFINYLLKSDCVPVFCAITHDGKGQLLNTNADSIAAQIAIAFSEQYEVSLHYCFEQLGVLKDMNQPSSLIKTLNYQAYQQLKEDKTITGGMIPKLDYAFEVLQSSVKNVILEHPKHINTSIKTIVCHD